MIEAISPTLEVIARAFKDAVRSYYRSVRIKPDFDVPKKEFGVGALGRKIAKRYITFKDGNELNKYLREEGPLYISYSVADWRYPDESNLDAKFFDGAELVFEFDDDEFIKYAPNDLVLCNGKHYTVGELLKRNRDPMYCEGSSSTIIPLPSEERWNAIVEKTKELIELLTNDLGFDEESITLNYSGNRGIHVHVKTDMFDGLDHEQAKVARQKITEYITLHTFDSERIIFTVKDGKLYGPLPNTGGQLGRMVSYIVSVLTESRDPSPLARYIDNQTLKSRFIRYVQSSGIDAVVADLRHGIYGEPGLKQAWRYVFDGIARKVGLPIDVHTSTDINRLIRLPNSIHGTTGLLAKSIPIDKLDEFNPYRDAVVLPSKPSITLNVKYLPEIHFNGKTYGPYENEEVKLPFNVGVYLLGVFDKWKEVMEDGGEH